MHDKTYRNPSDLSSVYTSDDLELIEEIPFILDVYLKHPGCQLSTLEIACVYDLAKHDVLEECRLAGRSVSGPELDQLVTTRAWDRIEYQHLLNGLTASAHQEIDHRERVEQLLTDVRQSVDRSAVAANAIDVAKRHPFLTGFFGAMVWDKIRSR